MDTLLGAGQPVVPNGRSARAGVDLRYEELVEEVHGEPELLFACGGLRHDPLL